MGNQIRPLYESSLGDCLALFDEQFSITEFSEAIEESDEQATSVIDSTKQAIKKAVANQENAEDFKYVVDMSDDIKTAIDKGEIRLVTSANGDVFAQIRDAKGHFGDKLPIKKELQEEGISVENLEMAIQMEAIKDQLKTMVETLKEIEGRVTEVIQGQHNDRIGLFYSGLSLYAESQGIRDASLKSQLTAQALRSVSDANSQMIQEMRASIEYLISGQYKKSKKGTEKIDEHLTVIHQCFDVVYRAAFLKAAIYQRNGEIASMLTVIDEYGRLVEKLIVPYVGKLSELDKTNTFIETGTWGQIANTLVGCKELRKQISTSNIYYLGEKEADADVS